MQEFSRKAGIIIGHVVCVLILIYCFADANNLIPKESKEAYMEISPTMEATIAPTEKPVYTQLPEKVPELTLTPLPLPTTVPVLSPTIGLEPNLTLTPVATPSPALTFTSTPVPIIEPTVNPMVEREVTKKKVLDNIAAGVYAEMNNNSDSWWFRRKENHEPSGSGEFFDISEYHGYYLDKQVTEEDKVIYLTIDCGYGSYNTAVLLDIFKEQDVKVTFFVTNNFLKANPKEARRMAEEGHLVGNHSVTHPDLTTLTDAEIYSEIIGCEEEYYNITGKQMDLFFRPPGGDYSRRTMQITKDLGYSSIFWSVAYYDYNQNDQPGVEYVLDHFEQYHHNGAVVLMHNDSSSNRDAMREVLIYLKNQGYRFGSLEELLRKEN